jgi:thiol:disulfide interchange protein
MPGYLAVYYSRKQMQNIKKPFFLFIICLVFQGFLFAQEEVSFNLLNPETAVPAGGIIGIDVQADIAPGWHLYAMDIDPGGPVSTSFDVVEDEVFSSGGKAVQPEPVSWFDENFNMNTDYFEGTAVFTVPVRIAESTLPGNYDLHLQVEFMLCNDSTCLPPQKKDLETVVAVSEGTGKVEEDWAGSEPGEAGSEDETFALGGELPSGALAYIWLAMTMGALALLTPCVFPMIPITVSFFTKRESASRGRSIFEAGVYSAGIVATFTVIGFLLTFMFGAGGINKLASSPWVNSLIAAVFILFALSLFGVVELAVPDKWLNAINRKSSSSKGLTGIILMALTFTLTSFTCTVPFIGTVMVAALQGNAAWALLGVVSFAVVFSLPFFLLALFPSWLHSLPRSGSWMNSVKVVMGFLELAAAMKFISNVDLVYQWEFLTRPVFISVWLAITLVTAIYLMGFFRFPHESVSESTGVFRILFAVFFVAVTAFLLRGMMGFPLGELDAFLPPRDYGKTAVVDFQGSRRESTSAEQWLDNFEEGLVEAKRLDKPIFLDFTGYTCTNCRWMESNIFPRAEVRELIGQYVLVRLYTDGSGEEHEANRRLESERFGTIALPYYAVVSKDDKILKTFPGLTRDPQKFIQFLEAGLTASR